MRVGRTQGTRELAQALMDGTSEECWLCHPEVNSDAERVARHIRMVKDASSLEWISHLCSEHKVELAAALLKQENAR